ncbi:MAG: HEPN domain-containing protein [Candidatus Thermoplasmatota archaeon]
MKNEEFVLEWLRRARSNLERAKAGKISEGVLYEDLCFDCQQAAEKAIKALLISTGKEFPWEHSIPRLLELVEDAGIEIPVGVKGAIDLTDYAVKTRYPGGREPVTEEEYNKALKVAEKVYEWVTETIRKRKDKCHKLR